jgi:cytoskeletal protein RodZ
LISRKNIARILRKKRQEKNKRIDEVEGTGGKER